MAILQFRRGSTFTDPQIAEPFLDTDTNTLKIGVSGSSFISLLSIGTEVSGSFLIAGDISASGDISGSHLYVENTISASSIYLSNDLFVNDIHLRGDIFIGDEVADNIVVQGQFSGSLIPSQSNEFDLGSDVKKWRGIYGTTGSFTDVFVTTISGSVEGIGNVTQFSQSIDTRLDYLEGNFSQSVSSSIGNLSSTGSDHESRIVEIETTFSSSVDSRLDGLENFSSSQYFNDSSSFDIRLDQLEADSGSQEFRIENLEIFSSSQENLNQTFATTGSNTFQGRQVFTGSFAVKNYTDTPYDHIRFDQESDTAGKLGSTLYLGKNTTELTGGDYLLLYTSPNTSSTVWESPVFTMKTEDFGLTTYNEIYFDAKHLKIGHKFANEIYIGSGDLYRNPQGGEWENNIYSSVHGQKTQLIKFVSVLSQFTGSIDVSGSVQISGSLSASLQEGHYWVGDSNGINLQVATSSFIDRITQLEFNSSSQESRLSNIEVFTSSQETKNTTLQATTGSYETKFTTLESVTSSFGNKLSQLETNSGSQDDRLNNLEQFTQSYYIDSQSIDSRLDEIETTFSSSVDLRLDEIETTFSSSVDLRLDEIETTFSTSIDLRLDDLELTGSDHEQRITDFETNSGSYARTDTENTFTELQTFNDIEVLGTASFGYIQSITGSAKIIGDAYIILNNNLPGEPYGGLKVIDSGSTDATASLTWDGDRNHWVYELSSGSTYKGGGFLSGPRLPSGSDISQIVYPTENYILKSIGEDHVSSSRIFDDGVQVKVETTLNVIGAVTGSTFVGAAKTLNFGGTNLLSSSVNFTTYTGSVDSKFNTLQTLTSSYSSRLNNLELDSSSQDGRLDNIELTTQSFDLRLQDIEVTTASFDIRLDQLESDSGSQDNRLTLIENFTSSQETKNTTLETTTSSYEDRLDQLEISSGSQEERLNNLEITSQSFDTRLDQLETDSGSQNTRIVELELTGSDHEIRINELETTFSSSVDLRLDQLETDSGSQDSRLTNLETTTSSLETRITQLETDSGSQENRINDLETFSQSLDSLYEEIASGTHTLVSGSSQINITGSIDYEQNIKARIDIYTQSLGDSITYDVSQSINDGNPDVLGSAGAVKNYIDEQFIQLGNISDVNGGDGLSGGGGSGSITLTLDTGSNHFLDGIKQKLDIELVISSSDQLTSSFDARYGNELGDGIVSSSDQVTQSLDNRYLQIDGDGVVSGSEQVFGGSGILSSSNEDFLTFSSSVDSILSSKLNNTTDTLTGDLTVTGKITAQEFHTELISSSIMYESGSTKFGDTSDDKHEFTGSVEVNGGITGSLLGTASTASYVDYSNIGNLPTLLSGSDQVTQSLDTRYLQIGGDGVISGSGQLDLLGYLNINGDDVVTSSQQIDVELTQNFSTFSSSVDLRLDDLESFSSSLDNDFVTQTELASATGALENSIDTKLNTSSYNTDSQSFDSRLDTIETTFSSSVDSRLDTIETTFSSSVDLRLDDLESFSSSLDTDFVTQTELSSATGSLQNNIDTKLNTSSYNTDSQSFDLRLDTIETTFSSSVDLRLDQLETFSSSLDNTFVTQTELASATGALENSIDTKLNTSSYNTDSQSFDSRLDTIETTFSSSVDSRLDTIETTFSSSVDSRLDNIEIFTSSQETKNTTLETTTGSYETRFTTLETVTSSLQSRSSNLELFTSSQETKNTTLETTTSSYEDRLTQLETETGSISNEQSVQDGRLFNLEVSTSSQEVKNTTLESVTQSLDSRLNIIELTTQSFDSRFTTIEFTTESFGGRLDNIEILTSSQETKNSTLQTYTSSVNDKFTAIQTATESLDQRLDSFEAVSASYARTDLNNVFGGIQTFNDINVNGTASFAYIQSTTGSAKIIGDAFIILNNSTPTERYAGLLVIDSGSNPSTASFFFDGQTNDWNYEYSGSGGIDYAVNIFGPEYSTKGSPTYLTNNRIPKAVDNHHLNDSNISDNGTLITLGSNTVVTGTFYATGTTLVSGSSQISYTGLSNIPTNIVSSSSDTTNVDITISNGIISANLRGGVVSGSSQVNADTITNFDTNVKAKLDADGVHSGSNQIVQFAKVGVGGASDATYELKVTGDIGATGDIVAYISSDKRLKENIIPISSPLEKINKLSGNSFIWNEEKQHIYKGKDYGVIAQEVQEIFPELVDQRENGYLAVKYEKLVAVLIEGIKELNKEVEELKSKLEK